MKPSEKKHLLKWNSILWIAAMVMPACFSLALGSTKFPWPMILPFLFFSLMLASNKMLSSAMDESGEAGRVE